jgi:hypothetical protein
VNAHPWGDPGTPSRQALEGRIAALTAELERREFDIQGALALHQDGVRALRHRLADTEDERARLEEALRAGWSWGQYQFSLDPERMGS